MNRKKKIIESIPEYYVDVQPNPTETQELEKYEEPEQQNDFHLSQATAQEATLKAKKVQFLLLHQFLHTAPHVLDPIPLNTYFTLQGLFPSIL